MSTRPVILCFVILLYQCRQNDRSIINTVTGPVAASDIGISLPHEHVIVDFIGADSIVPGRYNADSVFQKALPFLNDLKKHGCNTLFDCTPDYLGRDVKLLQRLSKTTGVNIVTNTGYYGAVRHKYLPRHVYNESASQLSERWINEFRNGISGTGIKPGFIKLSVEYAPLTPIQRKVIEAGALASRQTGLTVAVHSGDGRGAREALQVLMQNDVASEKFIWVHAQNEKDSTFFIEAAGKGAWVEFDGLSEDNVVQYVFFVNFMKQNRLLHRTLVSHDAGYYSVGEKNGGEFRPYSTLFSKLLPALEKKGFTKADIEQLIKINPAKAFSVNDN